MSAGYELVNMLPYARTEIEQMMKAVVNNILGDIQAGRLTPDVAMQKWIEYASYVRLLQRFEQKVKVITTRVDNNPTSMLQHKH